MLAIPTKGFARSVNVHRISPNVLCDWIEGSLLFQDDQDFLSQMDVADTLLDDERYINQGFALQGMKEAWNELRKREQWVGDGAATFVRRKRVIRRGDWQSYPAQSFCILLSLAPYYDWWTENEYVEQGEIFELLTKASFSAQFSEWKIFQTGWSRSNTVRLTDIATKVARLLGEQPGDIETWDDPQKKEQGLDLLCYRPFPDKRRGIPVYLMQCASGYNWDTKLYTPDLGKWGDIIHFKNSPAKAFSTPFTVQSTKYKQCLTEVKGLFMERCRLLCAAQYDENWVSRELQDRIIAWAEPRIELLLKTSER